jgi:hypothetical protein
MFQSNDRFISLFQRVIVFALRNGWGILYFFLEAPESMELDRWVCSRWRSVCPSQLANYFTVTQKLDFVSRPRNTEPSQAKLLEGVSVWTGRPSLQVCFRNLLLLLNEILWELSVHCALRSIALITVRSAFLWKVQERSRIPVYRAYEKRVCRRCCSANGTYSTNRNKHVV